MPRHVSTPWRNVTRPTPGWLSVLGSYRGSAAPHGVGLHRASSGQIAGERGSQVRLRFRPEVLSHSAREGVRAISVPWAGQARLHRIQRVGGGALVRLHASLPGSADAPDLRVNTGWRSVPSAAATVPDWGKRPPWSIQPMAVGWRRMAIATRSPVRGVHSVGEPGTIMGAMAPRPDHADIRRAPGYTASRGGAVWTSHHGVAGGDFAASATISTGNIGLDMGGVVQSAGEIHGALQGDVFLDGARVGRWMARRLTDAVARPASGMTGFDPRLGSPWPGTLQGG